MTNQQDTALLPVEPELISRTDAVAVCLNAASLGSAVNALRSIPAHRLQAKPSASCEADEATDKRVKLPRLSEKMIRAACKAHYGEDNIDGIDLTANGCNYTFRDGFKRMWKGVATALRANAPEARGEVDRYLSDRFEWAAPGDQQEDAWLVRFCDKECGEAIFTGPEAERAAWEYWNRYAPSYNLYVFRLAALASGERAK